MKDNERQFSGGDSKTRKYTLALGIAQIKYPPEGIEREKRAILWRASQNVQCLESRQT
jgi:hypothetical protein